MRNIRCSGRLGGVLPRVVCVQGGVCQGVDGGVWLRGVYSTPTVNRIIDTRWWKHYLSATTVGDGKNSYEVIMTQNRFGDCAHNCVVWTDPKIKNKI